MQIRTGIGTTAVVLLSVLAFQGEGQAQTPAGQGEAAIEYDGPVTYASHVASIVNENCAVCHRDGGIGPMRLTTYEEVRPWARLVKQRVANHEMPPYAYDRDIGIQDLKEDWRLDQEDIDTIVSWVDAGAPMGNPADLPAPVKLPDTDEWVFTERFGPPDLVIPSPPIDVPADGNDMWHRPFVPTGLTQERCIKAAQVKPAGTAKTVVHHANSTLEVLQEDGTYQRAEYLTEYAMGKIGELMPDDVCRVMPVNSVVRWNLHLYPGGLGAVAPNTVLEDNVVELGIWLHPEGYKAKYRQDLASYGLKEQPLDIPPNGTQVVQGHHTFDHPVRIDSWQPHGHLRLRQASIEIFYPETSGAGAAATGRRRTGRTEVVSVVSNWSAAWHQSHIYEDDVAPLVPAGAVLILKQFYDNTADNPNNPDPDQWVDGGSRTSDEMSHAWIAVTHLDEEGYQQLVAEREQKKEAEARRTGN